MITRQDIYEYRMRVGDNEAYVPVVANESVQERIFLPKGARALVIDRWQEPYCIVLYGNDTMLCDSQYLDLAAG